MQNTHAGIGGVHTVAPELEPGVTETRLATLDHTDIGDTNLGAALPAGAIVVSIWANVSQAFDGINPSLKIGDSVDDDRLMTTAENNLNAVNLYNVDNYHRYAAPTIVIANLSIGGAPTQGSVDILLRYVNGP